MSTLEITSSILNDFASNGVEFYRNSTLVTAPATCLEGDLLKMVATRGSFSYIKLFDPIMDADHFFTLTNGNTEGHLNMPFGYSMTLDYGGTFPVALFTYSSAMVTQLAIDNLQMFVNDVPANASGGSTVAGDVIKLEALNNYIITSAGFFNPIPDMVYPMTISLDGLIATITLDPTYSGYTLQYEVEIGVPVDTRGSNSVYVISDEDIKTITEQRFLRSSGSAENMTVVDDGQFILGFIKLPFDIDPANIVGSESIRLGLTNTGVVGQVLNTDRLRVSLGSITTTGTTGSALDYTATTAILHLPFTNPIAIDIDYVMDQTISIEMSISLYDGSADYNITSTKIEGVIFTEKVKLDIEIPFGNLFQTPSKNSPFDVRMGIDNGVKTPYIELLKYKTHLANGVFTLPVEDEDLLTNHSGYVKVSDIALSPVATLRERDMLHSRLSDGVFLP